MCKTTFEQRLERLTKLTDALDALNEAEKRYLAVPGNEFAYDEISSFKKEYQIAAATLHHAIEQIK